MTAPLCLDGSVESGVRDEAAMSLLGESLEVTLHMEGRSLLKKDEMRKYEANLSTQILVDDNGSHYVSPRNAPASSMITSRKVVYSHFIFRFDFNDWKLMTRLVAENSELMPRRTKLNPCDGSQSDPNSKADSNQITRTTTKA
ncbi:hypothetical protein L1987_34722 [Smallanthus sonchifolius]|uniref:Uncharacterized protein n=1 Tax=Smallanthus sonchifolius TaxID=185202 RepID=A0ACB9HUG5_9ASTR|nr:hypothetical protein L1987_34722 [Smallanthus sonchifolius]